MKKILTLAAFTAILALSSCGGDNIRPVAEFANTLYTVYSNSTVEITVNLSEEAAGPVTIPVTVSGSATEGSYALSSSSITISSGTTGKISLTDKGMEDGATVILILGGGKGYLVGNNYSCTVALDGKENLIYDFNASKTDLIESAKATITVRGQRSGANFKASEDITIPFMLKGEAASLVKAGADAFVISKGTNTATVTFTPAEGAAEALEESATDPVVTVELEGAEGRSLLPGDVSTMVLKLHSGVQLPSRLAGTWVFDRVYALDELEFFFSDDDADDPDLLPTHNEGFMLTFTEDEESGEVTLTPSGTGDFANFFRECTVSLTEPAGLTYDAVVQGKYTASELNMFMALDPGYDDYITSTFYRLSTANRAFSAAKETPGPATVSFRLTEEGGLELQLRDYDEPPFGFFWWTPGKFDVEMFGFASLFTRAE